MLESVLSYISIDILTHDIDSGLTLLKVAIVDILFVIILIQ